MKQLYKNNPDLKRLNKILNYDLDDKMPGAGYLFHGLYGTLGMLLALIGTPLILWSLVKLKRFGWVIAFTVLIAIPLFISGRGIGGEGYLDLVILYVTIGIWVIYMALLRITARDWEEPIFLNRPGSDL